MSGERVVWVVERKSAKGWERDYAATVSSDKEMAEASANYKNRMFPGQFRAWPYVAKESAQ